MKKKGLVIFLLLFMVLLFNGCSSKEGTFECTRTANYGTYKMNLLYTVEYNGNYVKKVKSTEKIESDDKNLLEQYKTQIENQYSAYSGIENYNYEVKIEENILTSTVDIDYEKVDTDKMIEIDSANSQLIKNGKILTKDLKTVYESIGATCNEK